MTEEFERGKVSENWLFDAEVIEKEVEKELKEGLTEKEENATDDDSDLVKEKEQEDEDKDLERLADNNF